MSTPLQGIIPALITPYGSDDGFDREATRALVEALIAQGVGGVYLGGTTGEGPLQSATERTAFTALVAELVDGRVPVIAHVGTADTAGTIAMATNAAAVGAQAVSAVVPFYYNHGPEQIRSHFVDIADASPVPFLPYYLSAPGDTGGTQRLFVDLAEHENVVGFKYTSRDVHELQQLVELCDGRAVVFNGSDEVCVHGVLAGAVGAIGSTYNFMAGLFVRLLEALRSGDVARAVGLQAQANAVIRDGAGRNSVAHARAILRAQGFAIGDARRPIEWFSAADHARIEALVEQTDFLQVRAAAG